MKTLLITALFLAASFVSASPPAADPATPSASTSDRATLKHEKQFSKLDANNDTFVDRDEFKKGRAAAKKPERAEKRFARTDKNSDGKLSKEEWVATPTRKNRRGTSA